jgi:N-acetylglucosamine malate deacetylase 2
MPSTRHNFKDRGSIDASNTVAMVQKSDVLIITAHPDDEIFASGTICLCVDKGFRVGLVCATAGEGGSKELLQRASNIRLGEVRRREMELSGWVLGTGEVSFFGQADTPSPDDTGSGSWDQTKLVSALVRIVASSNPELILTHGPFGGYGHPAHRLLHHCTMTAAREISFAGSIFSFCGQVKGAFFSWHFDQPSDVLIDARAFLRRRVASLSYHQSQLDYFVQPHFPRTVRKFASALFGYTFAFSEAGRKRIPIVTATRFFQKFPVEGLVLQKNPDAGRPHFFLENFANASQVQINR